MKNLALLAMLAAGPAYAGDGDLLAQVGLGSAPVNLTAGRDYMLKASETEGDGTGGYLIDPGGQTALFVPYNGDGSADADARAAYSATYTVKADGSAWVYLYEDCAASTATRCGMSPSSPAAGASTSFYDVDAFRMSLRAGHAYTWLYGSPTGLQAALLDGSGRQIKGNHTGRLTYRPAKSGTYFLTVARSHGGAYRVTMK